MRFLLRFAIMILYVLFAMLSCDRSEPQQKSSSPTNAATPAEPRPPPSSSPAASSGQYNLEPRPQGPDIWAGGIERERLYYFFGRVNQKGIVEGTDTSDTAKGGDKNTVVKFTKQKDHDPCHKGGDWLPLYFVELDGRNLCDIKDQQNDIPDHEADSACGGKDNRKKLFGKAIAIPGWWNEKGEYKDKKGDKDVFTFACISGIAAKCAHWGYIPWLKYDKKSGKWGEGGEDLKKYYIACVHAARADYGADGDSMTCDRTTVDIFDDLGIRVCSDVGFPKDKVAELESSWKGDGHPSCVRKGRYNGCEEKIKKKWGKEVDSKCDDNFSKCPTTTTWPSGTILRIRAPSYDPPGKCPERNEDCPQ